MEHKLIYLTGFMGSGKTTVGSKLGERWSMEVIDTDQWIEHKERKSIAEIFAGESEAYFRDLETEALKTIKEDSLIITTGGGIVEREENRKLMKLQGKIVYLYCGIEEIIRRLEGDTSRPLIQHQDEEKITALYRSRMALYEEADVIIDTTRKSVEEIVEEITLWRKKG
ncbi:shikimate kinase I [Halalkalibacter hemicellulosilyticusJCM 9152]|uniref:Shikimate kinase n=1 Tax=Halalkalibacter hemicellulosilyticusJCM 9152 TaxID=1236971 RepID=W4QKH3_9BACI|nr:shikimate kinase I [Halalkalibacter hemicellulosilyticusJCM 9152]